MTYQWLIPEHCEFGGLGQPAATLAYVEIRPGFSAVAVAFDDSVQETIIFSGFWRGGKGIDVELLWRSGTKLVGSVQWIVGLYNKRSQSCEFRTDWRLCNADGDMCRQTIRVEHPMWKADPFHLWIARDVRSGWDTLAGDALLFSVRGLEVNLEGAPFDQLDNLQTAQKTDSTATEISDEEFARRAGIYRGPK